MAGVIYLLCALASTASLALLVVAYRRNGGRLVFWSAVCFAGLAFNNALLSVNYLILPRTQMSWRGLPAAIGLLALAYGLVVEEVRDRSRRLSARPLRRRTRVKA